MYSTGYLDVIREFQYFLEVLIHTVLYKHRIYPQDTFTVLKRFGIRVRCQEKIEVIRYVQQITEVFNLLLKDKILHAVRIDITVRNTGRSVATYNLEVEHCLRKQKIFEFDVDHLRSEFAIALMMIELRPPPATDDCCDFGVYFFTIREPKGALVEGTSPREKRTSTAYASALPLLEAVEGVEMWDAPRDYIQSFVVATGKNKETLDMKVPFMQLYRSF